MKTFSWYDHQKKVFTCFSANVGAMFWNQTTLGAIFVQIFREFARGFSEFARIINKSELLGWVNQNFWGELPASYTTVITSVSHIHCGCVGK